MCTKCYLQYSMVGEYDGLCTNIIVTCLKESLHWFVMYINLFGIVLLTRSAQNYGLVCSYKEITSVSDVQ